MEKGPLRVGVVGSSSLLGKELVEELADSVLGLVDVILLDEDVEAGQVTAAGDEATFVQRIEAGSFDGMDLCFFAGRAEDTLRHWSAAMRSGARIVDLTDTLAEKDGVETRAPWVCEASGGSRAKWPVPKCQAVTPAHPVAVMLGLVSARCMELGLAALAATVLEPASERGAAGLDEMHQQTVRLLSFQSVPREEYDSQVAFNLLSALGKGARVSIESTASRIVADYHKIGCEPWAPVTLQLIHAPVFHGYGVSLLLDFKEAVLAEAVVKALSWGHVEVMNDSEEAPSNASAAGQKNIMVKAGAIEGGRLWVWMVADNLKMRALLGIACAQELLEVRRRGVVQ